MLTAGFVVVIASALVGLRLGEGLLRQNPFAGYEALWPGQAVTSLVAYGRHLRESQMTCGEAQGSSLTIQSVFDVVLAGQPDITIVCTHIPSEGVFRSIGVCAEDGYIRESVFFSNGLHQDALLLYWGAPDAIRSSPDTDRLYLEWEHSTYTATAAIIEGEYLVTMVILTSKESIG